MIELSYNDGYIWGGVTSGWDNSLYWGVTVPWSAQELNIKFAESVLLNTSKEGWDYTPLQRLSN